MASDIDKLDEGLQAIDPVRFALISGKLLSNLIKDPNSAQQYLRERARFQNLENGLNHLENMIDLTTQPPRSELIKYGASIGIVSLVRYVEVEQS